MTAVTSPHPLRPTRHRGLDPVRFGAVAALPLALSSCDWVVMSPSGDIAVQQRDLILISTGLMLLIIVPVIVLTLLFAWRYRAANKAAKYEPNWDHSIGLELLIWGVPLLIIIALGAVTWTSTHLLDPYRPLARIKPESQTTGTNVPLGELGGTPEQIAQGGNRPIDVQVVALDWKWLFIYPEYGIATVNELAAPIDRPIRFKLTSSSVMNAFYIPALAGMIYTMPGMETTLHAVINKPGNYEGFSSNYSGAGFSGMRFRFHGTSQQGFDAWVARVKGGGGGLSRAVYTQLEKPSEKVPVRRFGTVEAGLFKAVVEQCVAPGKPCMSELMTMSGHGVTEGGGTEHGGMKMPAANGGRGPGDGARAEGAFSKDGDEKGEGKHWTAPADPKKGGAAAPGSQDNRDHTQLIPSPVPGTAPAVRG